MSTFKLIGLVLVILGAVLLYFGINQANSPVEELGETLTGRYSDQTMTYLIGGAVAGVAGLVLLLKGK